MRGFIDVNFYPYQVETSEVVNRYKVSFEYLAYMRRYFVVEAILHTQRLSSYIKDDVSFTSFTNGRRFWSIPFRSLFYLRRQQPEIILVQGLVFPLQVLLLKLFLNKDCIVLAQHHGERPFKNRVKKTLQAYADKAINGYLFTATGNAEMWVNADIIANKAKCHQVLEAATFFTRIDKAEAIKTTGMDGSVNFLWVGRLNENKDPITVLNAFGIYASKNPGVRLYMIYQDGKLLPEVVSIIKESAALANSITLVGKTEHSELPNWYSAADYLLSGSHREGSGYALIEAMACGCVPVVTDIPPFKAITNAGMYGYFYTPGDTQALYLLLDSLAHDKHKSLSDEIVQYSREHLSFCKIADDIHLVYKTIKTGRSAP